MLRRTLTTVAGILVLAGTIASAVLADPPPGFPPLQGARFDGRSPDTKDAAYTAHHSNARTYNVAVGYASPPDGTTFDGRSPDTKDAAYAAHHARGAATTILDGRSPDTRDAAALAQTVNAQTAVTSSSGFAWDDAAIGAGIALAAIALLGLGVGRLRNRRLDSLPS